MRNLLIVKHKTDGTRNTDSFITRFIQKGSRPKRIVFKFVKLRHLIFSNKMTENQHGSSLPFEACSRDESPEDPIGDN